MACRGKSEDGQTQALLEPASSVFRGLMSSAKVGSLRRCRSGTGDGFAVTLLLEIGIGEVESAGGLRSVRQGRRRLSLS